MSLPVHLAGVCQQMAQRGQREQKRADKEGAAGQRGAERGPERGQSQRCLLSSPCLPYLLSYLLSFFLYYFTYIHTPLDMHKHTCIHLHRLKACMHACIQVHTHIIPIYLPTYHLPTYLHYLHYLHTCAHTYIRAYKSTYMHDASCMHLCMRT